MDLSAPVPVPGMDGMIDLPRLLIPVSVMLADHTATIYRGGISGKDVLRALCRFRSRAGGLYETLPTECHKQLLYEALTEKITIILVVYQG